MALPEISPVAGYVGADVGGVDLGSVPDEPSAQALRDALARHLVLFFRDQTLDLAGLKRVTELFGPVMRVPYVEPSAEDPDVIAVLKEADETGIAVFGGDWHSDFSFLERPPAGSVLLGVEIPPYGGDTLWSSQIAAYETLPAELAAAVEGRDAVHLGAPYGVRHAPPADMRLGRSIGIKRGDPLADREILHPLVRVHASSGRRALFINRIYTTRIAGLEPAESRALLKQLYQHATRPEFTCRFRWQPGSVAIWDNRATQHYAINDYDGHRRLMYRTTFAGERPYGVPERAASD